MVECNTHLQHWKRKCRQKGQGKDVHLDFTCLEIKLWVGCWATAPPWCTLGSGWTSKVNSKCPPCLDCMLQFTFIGISTTATRDRNLFCYRNSQICTVSESGVTTPLNSRYPKTDSFSKDKQKLKKCLLQMQSRKWKERKKIMMLLSCIKVKPDISGNLSQPFSYYTDLPPLEQSSAYTHLKCSWDATAAPIISTHTVKTEMKLVRLFGFFKKRQTA